MTGVIITQCVIVYLDSRKYRKERAKDREAREFTFKREAYTSFATSIQLGTLSLSKLVNMSAIELKSFGPDVEIIRGLVAKDLVANNEVADACQTASKVYLRGLTAIMSLKMTELIFQTDIDTIQPTINRLLEQSNKIVDEVATLHGADPSNQSRFRELDELGATIHERLTTLITQQLIAIAKRGVVLQQMTELMPTIVMDCKNANAAVTAAMRKELGFSPDVVLAGEELDSEARAMLENLTAEVWQRVNAATSKAPADSSRDEE